jgi:hypothetical protein
MALTISLLSTIAAPGTPTQWRLEFGAITAPPVRIVKDQDVRIPGTGWLCTFTPTPSRSLFAHCRVGFDATGVPRHSVMWAEHCDAPSGIMLLDLDPGAGYGVELNFKCSAPNAPNRPRHP